MENDKHNLPSNLTVEERRMLIEEDKKYEGSDSGCFYCGEELGRKYVGDEIYDWCDSCKRIDPRN